MANIEQINKAIGAHGMWKLRLRQAVDTGKSEFTVEHLQVDNQCDFGRWLYSLPPEDRDCEHWRAVQVHHANFHSEAARILKLAVEGHKPEAEEALRVDSAFADVSAALTCSMMKWKSDLS